MQKVNETRESRTTVFKKIVTGKRMKFTLINCEASDFTQTDVGRSDHSYNH